MAEEKRDYYDVLGVDKSVSDDDLKKAYRKAAKKYHPDLHPGDAEAEKKFKEVNEAYAVLSDPDKKNKYDRFGHAGVDSVHASAAVSAEDSVRTRMLRDAETMRLPRLMFPLKRPQRAVRKQLRLLRLITVPIAGARVQKRGARPKPAPSATAAVR